LLYPTKTGFIDTHVGIVSFGQGSSLLWTHTLRPFYSRLIALIQEGGQEFG